MTVLLFLIAMSVLVVVAILVFLWFHVNCENEEDNDEWWG